jgi:hypothetical protein
MAAKTRKIKWFLKNARVHHEVRDKQIFDDQGHMILDGNQAMQTETKFVIYTLWNVVFLLSTVFMLLTNVVVYCN